MPFREILIANRHPRLRLGRRAVARVIHTLDAHFTVLPGDRKFLGQPASHHFLHPGPENRNSDLKGRDSCVAPGELSLVFLTDAALARLHADFLADPAPTDVITFNGDPAAGTAGEICVSADAARRQVGAHSDFSAELTLYLVHGWLHLAGYDDRQPLKKRRMRRAEARALRLLRTRGAFPRFSLRR